MLLFQSLNLRKQPRPPLLPREGEGWISGKKIRYLPAKWVERRREGERSKERGEEGRQVDKTGLLGSKGGRRRRGGKRKEEGFKFYGAQSLWVSPPPPLLLSPSLNFDQRATEAVAAAGSTQRRRRRGDEKYRASKVRRTLFPRNGKYTLGRWRRKKVQWTPDTPL